MDAKEYQNQLTFAIDVDEVLRNTLNKMIELYNLYFNDTKQYDDVHSFICDESFPRIKEETGVSAGEWFFQLHGEEIFSNTEPIDGAIEAVKTLQQYGRVIIITYQKTVENKIQTLKWLEKFGFPTNEVCFLKDKTKLHTDFFIDDNDWNFIGCNSYYGILVNAPYNQGKDIREIERGTNLTSMYRVSSLKEFADDFKKYMVKNRRKVN